MNICIYCGSSTGFRKEFVELAEEFGEMMAKAGFIKPENMSIFNVAETLEDCIRLSMKQD